MKITDRKKLHRIFNDNYDELLKYYYCSPCSGCGCHPSFWKTIIESKQWKLWQEEQDRRMAEDNCKGCYDMSEVEELGIISPEHWRDFLLFVGDKNV